MGGKDSDYDGRSMFAPILNSEPANRREITPAGAAEFQLWFATSQGQCHFDPVILTAAQRRRFDAMRNPRRREEFSLSRALLAHAAIPAARSLSLSHSGGHAALATGPAECAVGVDLEQHRARDIASIGRFAFSERESSALGALASPERERRFYLLWVMKEALAKALRLPLLEALRSCDFSQQGGDWSATVPTQRSWSILAFEPRPAFSLAIACVANEGKDLPSVGPGVATGIETREWPSMPLDPRREMSWPCVAAITSADRRSCPGR